MLYFKVESSRVSRGGNRCASCRRFYISEGYKLSKDRIEVWHADDGADRHRAKDRLPRLAMDGVLCDRPQPGCCIGGGDEVRVFSHRSDVGPFSASRKESKVAKKTLTTDELSHYVGLAIKDQSAANRYWNK